jgi:hypothetical protein
MRRDLLTAELLNARDVGDVVNVITRLSRPYGDIQHWKFSRHPRRNVLRFFIQLERPEHHTDLARQLGGQLENGEVCFEVQIASVVQEPADDDRALKPIKP